MCIYMYTQSSQSVTQSGYTNRISRWFCKTKKKIPRERIPEGRGDPFRQLTVWAQLNNVFQMGEKKYVRVHLSRVASLS
jgi:hypothetical protein